MSEKSSKPNKKANPQNIRIPLWVAENSSVKTAAATPERKSHYETEVCVVGGGLAGVSVALELSERGKKVLLVDRGEVGGGQTSRTTAHLAWALENRIPDLVKMHGIHRVRSVIETHQWAIQKIEATSKRFNIDCDFRYADGYLFLGENEDESFLEDSLKAYHRCSKTEVELVENTPWFQEEASQVLSRSALRFPKQAQFHPLKYLNGLVKVLKSNGVQILENAPVGEVKPTESGVTITTKDGSEIKAKSVVITTMTPVNNRFVLHTKQAAYRTYAIALEMKDQPPTAETVLLWDTEDPYHYVRRQDDLLIVGGEDHKTGQPDESSDPFSELEKWAHQHFPFVGSRKHAWSGQVMETMDDLPYIGHNPTDPPNVFVVTGHAGMGMTYSVAAGQLIADLVEKKLNAWERLYEPSRFTLSGLTEFIKENTNTGMQYKDWLTPGDVKDAEELEAGEGAIIRKGLEKLAVYKDENGTVHSMCATCPHLYALVRWNPVEKTWDCPCHGSRFDRFGSVIDGPAVSGLTKR